MMLRIEMVVVEFAVWVFSDPVCDFSMDSVYRGFA